MPDLTPDLLLRRATRFVLWRPAHADPPPVLVIGRFVTADPPRLNDVRRLELTQDPDVADLWAIDLADCDLGDGVYHYWFEVLDSLPGAPADVIQVTDPAAATADWRLLSPGRPVPGDETDRSAPAVVLVSSGRLIPCDPMGELPDWEGDAPLAGLQPNNRTVFYELPTQWTRAADENGVETAIGTFQDVLSLVDRDATSPNFSAIQALAAGRSYLAELGVTTLELLPIADSCVVSGWKYGTANYLAPDHTLGFPDGAPDPIPNVSLARLISACHRAGIRFVLDAVMGFSRQDSYRHVNFTDFHVVWNDGDPEQDGRNAWGGDLWKYNYMTLAYDPISGAQLTLVPARQMMLTFIAQWILDQRIDGIRVDSVDTIYNWDFVGEFTRYARALFLSRAEDQGLASGDAEARFLVVGEDLSMPKNLVGKRLDALWNDEFKYAVRAAILGRVRDGDPDFEYTVRKIIDCRMICDFTDGAQAVNYVTSHDVGNYGSSRLYNFLNDNGVIHTEQRIKLAYVCLLTAVGIPMIFAGEEFGDQQDLPLSTGKETDPVNFNRLQDPWRKRIFEHVARLVKLRTRSEALAVNDTEFIHTDLTPGRRVFAWMRGPADDPVVVVANFSDWQTDDPASPTAEYVVPNWPSTPDGRSWVEITESRDVPPERVGREPISAWGAKVYTLA
jgi:pullulanase